MSDLAIETNTECSGIERRPAKDRDTLTSGASTLSANVKRCADCCAKSAQAQPTKPTTESYGC
nr:hypothetical protein [Kibdelosporangium sp. MJ126-NF4]CTQ91501.1 hypothetical protein [Kibdelosporangium sp. MJ126-NF4]